MHCLRCRHHHQHVEKMAGREGLGPRKLAHDSSPKPAESKRTPNTAWQTALGSRSQAGGMLYFSNARAGGAVCCREVNRGVRL